MKKDKEAARLEAENNLKELARLGRERLFSLYESSEEGLGIVEAEDRLDYYGENLIDLTEEKSLARRLLESVANPFNLVLILIGAVTFVTDVALAKTPSYETFILIIAIVAVSSLISFFQQEKSGQAAKKLKSMISSQIDVIRGGESRVIDIGEAVPGDVVKLSSGDMIPGDVRFLTAKDLFIDQAALTGESDPSEKFLEPGPGEEVTALKNIGFLGTNVVSGSATALILHTGNDTYFGSMARSISTDRDKSGFERGVDALSRLLITFMLFMLPVIFLVNFLTKNDFVDSLLFGVTIAVGLMPEMLPVIMASTLSKGAVAMSRKKTIVKRLSAIQAFGEMDILCTDKTGTLTEDRIILEKYMDALGADDPRVLRHAFLNSYYQTGLKNLIDLAIIARAEKEGLSELKERYIREDEIPFDFTRRVMSVVLTDRGGKRQLITKGAVEEMLAKCAFVEIMGEVRPLDGALRARALALAEAEGKAGLRVLAVAQKNEIHDVESFGVADESDMVLIGFVGFLDPPKESARPAIEALKKHGVGILVLTGDSEGVAKNVCDKLSIPTKGALTGADVEAMSDEELKERLPKISLLSKLTPFEKRRVVRLLQESGRTVGYLGDGINDAPPMRQADVGISVDSAVDIAKETADIILLEKDLMVLEEGVVSGRRTFANILKYLKMSTSGNFGNMLSVLILSAFLPFLPLLPVHILIQNLLCDFAQLGMPFDRVEEEYIAPSKKWGRKSLRRYMFFFGPVSTLLEHGLLFPALLCAGVQHPRRRAVLPHGLVFVRHGLPDAHHPPDPEPQAHLQEPAFLAAHAVHAPCGGHHAFDRLHAPGAPLRHGARGALLPPVAGAAHGGVRAGAPAV